MILLLNWIQEQKKLRTKDVKIFKQRS